MIATNKSLNFSLLDQALVSGSNFLSTVLIARILGLHDFGIFTTLWLILLFITAIHHAIIVFPMMSLTPKQKNLNVYFGNLLVMQIYFSIFAFIVSYLFSLFYIEQIINVINFNTIFVFASTVLLYHMQDFYRRYFFVKKSFKDVFVIDALSYLTRTLILFYLMIYSIPSTLFNIYLIFISTFLIGICYGIVKYKFTFRKTSFLLNFKEQWKLSKWLLPSAILEWTSINLFLVIASFMLGPIAIGAIRLGQNIIMGFNVILQGLENFIPTDASKIYYKKGISHLHYYLLKVTTIGVLSVIFFGILIIYYSHNIISLIYGNNFLSYSYVLTWYTAILFFMFLFIILRIYLRTINQMKIWFKAYIITSLYSMVVVYPLLSYYQIHGVLFGILSAYILLISSAYYMLSKKINI